MGDSGLMWTYARGYADCSHGPSSDEIDEARRGSSYDWRGPSGERSKVVKVHELMTTAACACNTETKLSVAARLMGEANCGIIPIVEESGAVVGVITDRDIAMALAMQDLPARDVTVRKVMSTHVATCAPFDTVETAMATMRKRRVRRLPVLSPNGGLEGILSLDDLAARVGPGPGAPVTYEAVAETLKAVCNWSSSKAASAD